MDVNLQFLKLGLMLGSWDCCPSPCDFVDFQLPACECHSLPAARANPAIKPSQSNLKCQGPHPHGRLQVRRGRQGVPQGTYQPYRYRGRWCNASHWGRWSWASTVPPNAGLNSIPFFLSPESFTYIFSQKSVSQFPHWHQVIAIKSSSSDDPNVRN